MKIVKSLFCQFNQFYQNVFLNYIIVVRSVDVSPCKRTKSLVYLLLTNHPIFHIKLATTVITLPTEKSNVMCGIFHLGPFGGGLGTPAKKTTHQHIKRQLYLDSPQENLFRIEFHGRL